MKLYITCGIAFAGKGVLSKAICERVSNCVRTSKDDYYAAIAQPYVRDLLGRELESPLDVPETFSELLWEASLTLVRQATRDMLAAGKTVIFDDINIYRSERDYLRILADECGTEPVLIFLDIPTEVARERMERNRHTKLHHEVDDKSFQIVADRLERPTHDEHPLILRPTDNLESWLDKHISA